MKKKIQSLLILGGLTAALFAVSACGETAPPPAEEPAVVAATPSPTPEAAQAQPDASGNEGPAGLPAATASFTPGVQTVTVPGWQEEPMTVQVTFSENQILDIEILEHNESKYGSGWALRALPGVPDQILVRQSTMDIDAFTGATSTRSSVIAAVEEAITAAGANPADLTTQFITAPLPGDRFIPGYVEITVPANTMDIYGNPLAGDATRMLWNEEEDMTLRLSFGRNEFHLHTGGARGLGQGNYGHGESAYGAGEIGGGTWGGWWFRQVVNHQVNDRQTTQLDMYTGATMSASAIIWGVEQAMMQQGADPADISPRAHPRAQIMRNPGAEPDAPFFEPGIYTVTVDGFGGPMEVRVTLDRTTIRRIEVLDHNETESFWDMVWGADADHIMRNAIFEANAAEIDSVDVVAGATVSSQALIDAVKQAMAMAWID